MAESFSKIIEQATELLSKFSIPLYLIHENKPQLFGTGFFVKSRNSFYFVSAAHVLDQLKDNENTLFFYTSPNTIQYLFGRRVASKFLKSREDDLIDVAILKVSQFIPPPYKDVDKFAVDIESLIPDTRPRAGRNYVVIGFPATKSSIHKETNSVIVSPYAYRNNAIDDLEYIRYNLNLHDHIALRLKLKKSFDLDGKHMHFPKPQGMSGSPIFILYDEVAEDSHPYFPVIGVATSYRRTDNLLFGTDVKYVLDAIAHVENVKYVNPTKLMK